MLAFNTLLALLALSLVSVSAAPLHNKRKCRPHSDISISSQVAIATSSIAVSTTKLAASTTSAVSASSTEVASRSSTKVTSTHQSSFTSTGTPTSTSKKPTATSTQTASNDSNDNTSSGLLKQLFPVAHSAFWTTSTVASDALPLSDKTLGVTKLMSSLSHNYVTAPDGKLSMRAVYNKGSYKLIKGGLSFYATGPDNFDLDNAKEATLSYSVYFEEDFDFVKGGKLPGFYGGNSAEGSVSCSGGSRNDACFSTRFMWRTGGAGELYTYLPPSFNANNRVCNVAPQSDCNPTYGASVGRGSFHFKAGTRTTIGQRVRLNDAGKENGEIELFVEGESIFTVTGLVLRNSDAGRIRGIQMQTFFGGNSPDWAPPKTESSYFSDFSVAVTEAF